MLIKINDDWFIMSKDVAIIRAYDASSSVLLRYCGEYGCDERVNLPVATLARAFAEASAGPADTILDLTPEGVAAIKKKYGPQPFDP